MFFLFSSKSSRRQMTPQEHYKLSPDAASPNVTVVASFAISNLSLQHSRRSEGVDTGGIETPGQLGTSPKIAPNPHHGTSARPEIEYEMEFMGTYVSEWITSFYLIVATCFFSHSQLFKDEAERTN